jgi:outer membrane protein assembly factor BamD
MMQRLRFVLPVALVLGAGCSAKQHLSADQYFTEANESFRTGALTLAIEQFHELLDQHPFSEYNEEAELKIAHAHYLAESYPEAIVALTDFQRRHPTSPHLPFVGYYLGMCYVQQMGTVDRDQTAARNALNYFLTVAQQYPDSPFAALARLQLSRCREHLAAHEVYVANFYARHDNDEAAKMRLLTVAARYGDTDTAADGLLRLARLYQRHDNRHHAALAYRAITELHPDSRQAAVALRALKRLPDADVAADVDPVDLLLAANGRRRSPGAFETVQVPGLEPVRTARQPSAPPIAPGFTPGYDPFGRNRARPF